MANLLPTDYWKISEETKIKTFLWDLTYGTCVRCIKLYCWLCCSIFLSLRLIPRKVVIRNASEEEVSDISFDDNDSLILKASSKHFKGYAIFLILILMHTITIYVHKHSSIEWDLLVCQNIFCVLEQIACVSFSDHLLSIISVCLSICKVCTFSTNLQILWANLNQTWHRIPMLIALKVV